MTRNRHLGITMTLFAALLAASTRAQSVGPDVIVGDLVGTQNYGTVGGIAAFSVGTTSCNIGNTTLKWFANTNEHPVIGQNLYRLRNGQFEQIGMSWLKHGFAALAGNVCGTCQNPGTQTLLGVNCSDPYSSSLNGQQSGLGPRSQVNAFTGAYPYPFTNPPSTPATIGKRLQVNVNDLDPAQNAGALYFAEGHYVTADDSAAGNQMNNVSYRRANIAFNGSTYTMTLTDTTQRQKPAIQAWKDFDPTVEINTVNIPGDGRVFVGYKATGLGGGMTRYEFAVYNMNSDRSIRGFTANLPMSGTVANPGFHDAFYHTGDGVAIGTNYSGTDWAFTNGGTTLNWQTATFATDPNANAIRWGSLYNFRFDSSVAPSDITLDLFKPGAPNTVNTALNFPQFTMTDPAVPATLNERTSQNVVVQTTNLDGAPNPAQAFLVLSVNNGPNLSYPLVNLGSGMFQGTLPALNCGSTIRWYISITPVGGGDAVTSPADAPNSVYTTNVVATTFVTVFADNMETNMGWTVTNSVGLTDGAWDRGVPVGGGLRGDPLSDGDGSGACWLTDNVAGNSDVDGGSTTLTSPVINLSGFSAARVNYIFWHDNNFGGTSSAQDDFRVEVTANGTNWVLVEAYAQNVDQWISRSINVSSFVPLTSTFRIRFTSSDLGGGAVIESGLDGVVIEGCPLGTGLDATATGNVGLGAGGPFNVLLVNGSSGNGVRRVDIGLSQPISIGMATPPSSMFPSQTTVFGFLGVPGPADQTVLPFSIGTMCFPPCLLNPLDFRLFAVADGLGVTASCPAILGAVPATPWTFIDTVGLGFPAQFTLQAVLTDPTQPAALAVSNGVLIDIAP